jgi:RNA polymerase sigma factor (sigma-70 family)
MRSEKDLIKGCRENDPRAQTAFYNLYKGRLMGICRRYAKNREEAEDIFQEAFIKIFKSIRTLQKDEAVGSWVRQIVVNTAINYYHQHLKQANLQVDYEGVMQSNDEHLNILGQLTSEEILTLINQLPDGYRMVFNLYVMEGYNHREIGEMLEIAENTSKSQLSRAKELLRRKLKEIGIVNYEQPNG